MSGTQKKGKAAEDLALRAYLAWGAALLCRNYRVKCGELDLILEEPGLDGARGLVIVEVRGRRLDRAWESPAESLSQAKLSRIRNATSVFLFQDAGDCSRWSSIRFDLAAWDGERLQIYPNFWWY